MSTSPTPPSEPPRRRGRDWWPLVGAMTLTALVTAGIVALLMNIAERKDEARTTFQQVVAR